MAYLMMILAKIEIIEALGEETPETVRAAQNKGRIYRLASEGSTSQAYPNTLPEALAGWHVYFEDCGHNILCVVGDRWQRLLERSAVEEDVAELLAPVSVKTVLRQGWEVHPRLGVILARGVVYDPMFGVEIPAEDLEF